LKYEKTYRKDCETILHRNVHPQLSRIPL